MAQLQKAVAIAAPFTAGFEGFRASPYFDVNGYAIGYGNHYYSDGTAVEQTDDRYKPAGRMGSDELLFKPGGGCDKRGHNGKPF